MNVILTQPVEIALRTLDEDDRRRVVAWLDCLKNWETDDYVRKRSHQLNPDEDVYVLKTSTDIRIFFRLEPDAIAVLDIARKETILRSGAGAEQGD
jgi:hypothetical protein